MVEITGFVPRAPRRNSRSPFTIEEKVAMLIAVKIHGKDAAEACRPYYEQRGLGMPKYPAQALSGFMQGFERAAARGEPEALELKDRFLAAMKEAGVQSR